MRRPETQELKPKTQWFTLYMPKDSFINWCRVSVMTCEVVILPEYDI